MFQIVSRDQFGLYIIGCGQWVLVFLCWSNVLKGPEINIKPVLMKLTFWSWESYPPVTMSKDKTFEKLRQFFRMKKGDGKLNMDTTTQQSLQVFFLESNYKTTFIWRDLYPFSIQSAVQISLFLSFSTKMILFSSYFNSTTYLCLLLNNLCLHSEDVLWVVVQINKLNVGILSTAFAPIFTATRC